MAWLLNLYLTISFISKTICSNKIGLEGRIVNGEPTEHDKYPFMVSLRIIRDDINENRHLCGASLIRSNPVTALTAAHCVRNWPIWEEQNISYTIFADIGRTVVVRDNITEDYERYNLSHYIIHKNFSVDGLEETAWDDIAVLFFDGATDKKPIKLNNYDLQRGDIVRAIGYGRRGYLLPRTDTLSYADLLFINDPECNLRLSRWYKTNFDEARLHTLLSSLGLENDPFPWDILHKPEGTVCGISNVSMVCSRDSGSPLLYDISNSKSNYGSKSKSNYIQIGIAVSTPINQDTGIGCVTEWDAASTWTDVSYYHDWIGKQLDSRPLPYECKDKCDTLSINVNNVNKDDDNICLTYEMKRLFDYGKCKKSLSLLVLGICDQGTTNGRSSKCNSNDLNRLIVNISSGDIKNIRAAGKSKYQVTGIQIKGKFKYIGGIFVLCLKNIFLENEYSSTIRFKTGKKGFTCDKAYIDGLPCIDSSRFNVYRSIVNNEKSIDDSWNLLSSNSNNKYYLLVICGVIFCIIIFCGFCSFCIYTKVKQQKSYISISGTTIDENDENDGIETITNAQVIATSDSDDL